MALDVCLARRKGTQRRSAYCVQLSSAALTLLVFYRQDREKATGAWHLETVNYASSDRSIAMIACSSRYAASAQSVGMKIGVRRRSVMENWRRQSM